jgi:hypothetical protein
VTPEQHAALMVLRNDIAEQIDGDSPTDSRYTDWAALADIALGVGIDPWHYMALEPSIKEQMGKT